MGRQKKYNRAVRFYHLPTNELIAGTLRIFKLFRPDLKTNQAIVDYAYNLFLKDFYANNIFAFEYKMLESIDKNFNQRLSYCYSYQEHKICKSRVREINEKFKENITKAEMFRRALYYTFEKYGLYKYNTMQPLQQVFYIDQLEDHINELDPEIQEEIRRAMALEMVDEVWDDKSLKDELLDDKTELKEQEDDKSLVIEFVDDKTEIFELIDDITLDYETEDYYEN